MLKGCKVVLSGKIDTQSTNLLLKLGLRFLMSVSLKTCQHSLKITEINTIPFYENWQYN